MSRLLETILSPDPPAFAIVHRPESTGPDHLDVLTGDVTSTETLAEVPLTGSGGPGHETLVVLPYRQVAERGFACHDDGAPLLAMTIGEQAVLPVTDVARELPNDAISLANGHFEPDDAGYAELVRRVVTEQIGEGAGANFVVKRSFLADITGFTTRHALSFFRRLLAAESSAYWTFVVYTGGRTFVGASPERHVSVRDGTAVMNPISGTYRYPGSGPKLTEVLDFLADRKEADELYMVLDEELKMMSRICTGRVRATGPYLREMATLAHTEYFIEGRSDADPREILRETMFAPTVTGSPLESACRVIGHYEQRGRGYYSGVVGLIGRDGAGARTLDSTILIRSAEIDASGRMDIGLGATLVRHSDPDSEVAETRAKSAGLLAALGGGGPSRLGDHPEVRAVLAERNSGIAGYWIDAAVDAADPALAGLRLLVVDAEDSFTAMLAHQLGSLGATVVTRRFDETYTFAGYDLVVMGPGPGDPRDGGDRKIARLRECVDALLLARKPFVAVCLSHQVLCGHLGLPVAPLPAPNQGVQRKITIFGGTERVGFYNTFAATCACDAIYRDDTGTVQVCRDAETGEVFALRGPHFGSVQFHAESVLTEDGIHIIARLMKEALSYDGEPVLVGA